MTSREGRYSGPESEEKSCRAEGAVFWGILRSERESDAQQVHECNFFQVGLP